MRVIIEDRRLRTRPVMMLTRAGFLALGIAVAVLAVVLLKPPSGSRSLLVFDPNRMADLEVDMWQAYYRKENLRLLRGLVVTLREQYRYSWAQAAVTGFFLARAAA